MENNKTSHPQGSKKFKETGLFLLDILYNALIIIALVFLIRGFLASPFRVVGSSMADTLEDKEFILIDKLSYLVGDIHRGDPIVFLPPSLNGDTPKFEKVIQTDINGYAKLDLNQLQDKKKSAYCQNQLSNKLWFCKSSPEEKDSVYFTPEEKSSSQSEVGLNTQETKKLILTEEEVHQGYLEFKDKPETNYNFKIYSTEGPEYFVKRVIGIPGDTVKIKGGKVYLKTPEDENFKEIDESFLNEKNYNNTYLTLSGDANTQGEKIFEVPEDHYFVLGDNRKWSSDSRFWLEPVTQEHFPYVPKENIAGKVFVVLWPLTKMQLIESADF